MYSVVQTYEKNERKPVQLTPVPSTWVTLNGWCDLHGDDGQGNEYGNDVLFYPNRYGKGLFDAAVLNPTIKPIPSAVDAFRCITKRSKLQTMDKVCLKKMCMSVSVFKFL